MTFFSKKLHQKWGWDWDLNKSLGLTLIQYKKLLNVKNKSDINNITPALFLLTLNIVLLPLLLTLNMSIPLAVTISILFKSNVSPFEKPAAYLNISLLCYKIFLIFTLAWELNFLYFNQF